jgi:hypothetical protein
MAKRIRATTAKAVTKTDGGNTASAVKPIPNGSHTVTSFLSATGAVQPVTTLSCVEEELIDG